jgi:hypothetical protein
MNRPADMTHNLWIRPLRIATMQALILIEARVQSKDPWLLFAGFVLNLLDRIGMKGSMIDLAVAHGDRPCM